MIDTIVKVLDISKNSYWNWKNQNRPIIALLEKYFSKDDLQEFLDTGKINRYEILSSNGNFVFELLSRIDNLEKKLDKLDNGNIEEK